MPFSAPSFGFVEKRKTEAFIRTAPFGLWVWLHLNVTCPPVTYWEEGSAVGGGGIFGTLIEVGNCGCPLFLVLVQASASQSTKT